MSELHEAGAAGGHMLQYALVTLDALMVEDTHAKDDRQLYREAAALYPEAGIEDGIKYPVRRMNYCPACKEYTTHNNALDWGRASHCPAVAALLPKAPEEGTVTVGMKPGFDTGPAKTRPVWDGALVGRDLKKWVETMPKWSAGPPPYLSAEPVLPPAPSLQKEIQAAAKRRHPDDDY